eukprot:scaffold245_cov256-Pinguiococcus_pyrenoidosus.AAC.7
MRIRSGWTLTTRTYTLRSNLKPSIRSGFLRYFCATCRTLVSMLSTVRVRSAGGFDCADAAASRCSLPGPRSQRGESKSSARSRSARGIGASSAAGTSPAATCCRCDACQGSG